MLNITSCPVCAGSNFKPFISCKDYTVSGQTFNIVECSACRFKFTNPVPEPETMGDYYKSENYISHSNTKKGLVSRLYHIVRNYTLGQKLKLVEAHVSRGTLLDYGCGTGMFLNAAAADGWKAFGIEPDAGARKLAQEGGNSIAATLKDFSAQNPSFRANAITLWHVLEHVPDLSKTISFLKAALDPGGVLIIAVPNLNSNDAAYYGEHWAAYDVPRHLYHFNKGSLEDLLNRNGFALTETRPMKFDSFYVSMLSEKYRHGKINYVRAFLRGLISNLSASSAHDYSSVIYIFKQK